jgi:hypothetical protein
MRKLLYIVSSFFLSLSSVLFSSCTQDAYEKGEGEYSLLRGDFAEAVVNSNKQVAKIITDDGDEMLVTSPYTAKWIAKADTTYRCMLYYNKVEGKAEVVSMGQVPCAAIVPLSKFEKELKTDPVKFESTWMSKTGRYLNLSIQVKSGVTDDTTAVQSLAIVSDTLITHSDGKQIRNLILHHDQGNVPEYYSTQVYVSIPTNRIDADSVRISINSYDGEVVAKHRCR